jgi:hypothetical protein
MPVPQEPKVKAPDEFTGKDPSKLPEFIAECTMVFQTQTCRYHEDASKVVFAGSYLRDSALSWFIPYLLLNPPPPILSDWQLFVQEMNKMFGDQHLCTTAENKIRALEMRETHKVTQYNIMFNCYAPYTGWNDVARAAEYYRSLPARIKDTTSLSGRPRTTDLLKEMALTLDQRYWEWEEEKSAEHGKSSRQQTASTSTSTEKPRNQQRSTTTSAASTDSSSTMKPQTSTMPTIPKSNPQTKTAPPDYAKNLSTDGHLHESEKERRKANGLCAYCGGKHKIKDCDKIPEQRRQAPPVTGRATFTFTESENLSLILETTESS